MLVEDWPDWSGRAVAIVASGPSAKKAGVASLKDRLPVLAIKRNVELAPFADVVYGCDHPWWRSVHGLKDFPGLKLAYAPRACDQYGCRKVDIEVAVDRILTERVGLVGSGGNSGFQALNLAVQFGARRVLLIGFDLHDRGGVHWYGRNTAMGMNNPTEAENFPRWRRAFAAAATELAGLGVEVVNASPLSDLKGFRQQGVAATLDEWGLT